MTDALTRILIADDHPVFRFGLRALLEAQPDMLVLGEAQSGAEALQMAATLDPDVLLMDVNMPGMNGIEATRKLTQAGERPAVLIFTMFDDDTVFTAMQAGARGYLLKGARGAETLRAIRAVANGEVIFSPGVSGQLMRYFTRGARADDDLPFPSLTPREREVLHLLARGLTNAAIAETLVLSPKTIRNQVSNIFTKLQVAGRSEAIVKAREGGTIIVDVATANVLQTVDWQSVGGLSESMVLVRSTAGRGALLLTLAGNVEAVGPELHAARSLPRKRLERLNQRPTPRAPPNAADISS